MPIYATGPTLGQELTFGENGGVGWGACTASLADIQLESPESVLGKIRFGLGCSEACAEDPSLRTKNHIYKFTYESEFFCRKSLCSWEP